VLSQWRAERSIRAARRFFYEWLTGKTVDIGGVTVGNYVDALPPSDYLAATSHCDALLRGILHFVRASLRSE